MKNNNKKIFFSFITILFLLITTTGILNAAENEIIIDNGSSGTSSSGTWYPSGGPSPYGPGSIYAYNTATYTWHANITVSGTYNVYMWWTEWFNRSTDAPVTITHSSGSQTVNVDQQANGGKWNLLGSYSFDTTTGATVTLNVPALSGSPITYSADAVRFVQEPITPTTFIVDNADGPASVSFVGSWPATTGTSGYWGANYTTDYNTEKGAKSVTFKPNLPSAGQYEVSIWYSSNSVRATNVPVDIISAAGINTATVNQRINGGQWVTLGTYAFNVGTGGSVRIRNTGTDGYVAADAVRFVQQPATPVTLILDNADGPDSVSFVGSWPATTATPGYWSANYTTDSNIEKGAKSVTFRPNITSSGQYEVSIWYSTNPSRATNVPIDINSVTGTDIVTLNQRINGGQWVTLGTYTFNAGTAGSVRIRNTGTDGYVAADAVRFVYVSQANIVPTAVINSINPNPASLGQTVTFSGSGTDSDGTIAVYSWRSSINGVLSDQATFTTSALSAGTHTIYFKVRDDKGDWSEEVSSSLVINTVSEIIVDNGASGTSYNGTWTTSGATSPYGSNSLYANENATATYTWHANLPMSGFYKVYMWWTEFDSRMAYAPVTITHSIGEDIVRVNQQTNGGKWNLLGIYNFDSAAGGIVSIQAISHIFYTTCADAVKFVYIPTGTNLPPVATIDSLNPNPTGLHDEVTFSGSGKDSDGTIAAYSWRSSINGVLSGQATFTTSALSAGTHTIYFKVRDDKGDWSEETAQVLKINNDTANTEHIYLIAPYAGAYLVGGIENTLTNLGATRDGMLWVYKNVVQNKIYIIHYIDENYGLIQTLKTPDAHVILVAHSNYGLGAVFANKQEMADQKIKNLYFMDDDRLFSNSSKWIAMSLYDCRINHSFPHWWPIFKNNESAVMPYTFNDPRGEPPYNYYLTYKVPNDPTNYRVETVRNSALQRFGGSGKPAWYSASGLTPDPTNVNHRQYYITNTAAWSPSIEKTTGWIEDSSIPGYSGETYHWSPAGLGENQFKFLFTITSPGSYKIFSRWPAAAANTNTACYTINHASGSSVIYADQRINGNKWNELGVFYFNAGNYSVVLNDNTLSGNVIADALRIQSIATLTVKDIDNVNYPKTHYGGRVIVFRGDPPIREEELKYSRMFYFACSTGIYYLDLFHRGKMFYTLATSEYPEVLIYLRSYLSGDSDQVIWQKMQDYLPIFDYYDFNKTPSQQ